MLAWEGDMWARSQIEWFLDRFGDRISARVRSTPLSTAFLAAIAMQETGYLWRRLDRGTSSEKHFLRLCVGDTLGWGRGRTYFPETKAELLDAPKGQEMYQVARGILEEAAQYIPSFRDEAASDHILFGYGIFQYDILFFQKDPDYFLERKWESFENCLDKALGELFDAVNALADRGYINGETPTAYELALAGTVYNRGIGRFDNAKRLQQGHYLQWAGKYYGELVYEYTKIAENVLAEDEQDREFPIAKIVNVPSRLNLRSSPGTENEPIGKLYHGTPVYVLDYVGADNKWAYISLEDDLSPEGYVAARYLIDA